MVKLKPLRKMVLAGDHPVGPDGILGDRNEEDLVQVGHPPARRPVGGLLPGGILFPAPQPDGSVRDLLQKLKRSSPDDELVGEPVPAYPLGHCRRNHYGAGLGEKLGKEAGGLPEGNGKGIAVGLGNLLHPPEDLPALGPHLTPAAQGSGRVRGRKLLAVVKENPLAQVIR